MLKLIGCLLIKRTKIEKGGIHSNIEMQALKFKC
jgi:hypothetical protein